MPNSEHSAWICHSKTATGPTSHAHAKSNVLIASSAVNRTDYIGAASDSMPTQVESLRNLDPHA